MFMLHLDCIGFTVDSGHLKPLPCLDAAHLRVISLNSVILSVSSAFHSSSRSSILFDSLPVVLLCLVSFPSFPECHSLTSNPVPILANSQTLRTKLPTKADDGTVLAPELPDGHLVPGSAAALKAALQAAKDKHTEQEAEKEKEREEMEKEEEEQKVENEKLKQKQRKAEAQVSELGANWERIGK